MWWFPSPAGNSLPEVFCICFFHAASHWRCAHSHPAVGWDRQAFLHICTFLLMLSQFTAEVLFIIPQVHALTLHAFELLPIPTIPALKVIQHFPCKCTSLPYYRCHPNFCQQQISRHSYLKWRVWDSSSKHSAGWMSKRTPVLFSLFSSGDFCLAGLLPSRQIITSVHFIICLSVLWCDTDHCVT